MHGLLSYQQNPIEQFDFEITFTHQHRRRDNANWAQVVRAAAGRISLGKSARTSS